MAKLEQVLVSLRRIMRATEIHAKALARETGLTTSQFLVLLNISESGELTIGGIAKRVNLSQATVTSIVDRLAEAGLVARQRGDSDKRKVFVQLTEAGRELVERTPSALQERFAERFQQLEEWQQSMILTAVEQIARLMDADAIDAAPVLDAGRIDRQVGTT